MEHCLIFLREIFCLNILCLKAVNEITARQTRSSLRKQDVIKLCSTEYLTSQVELVLPTFKSWTVHKIVEYLTLGLYCPSFEISITLQPVSYTHLTLPTTPYV